MTYANHEFLQNGNQTISGGTIDLGPSAGLLLDSSAAANSSNNSKTIDSFITGTGGLVIHANGDLSATGLGGAFNRPDITINAGGTWQLNAEQYMEAGDLILNGGTILVTNNDLRLQAGTMSVGASAGGSEIAGTGNGVVTLYASPTFNVANGAAAADLTVSAPIQQSGTHGFTNTGAGTMVISATNTYSGATNVSAGTLLVTGALGNTAVSVETGAVIGGSGSLGGSLSFAAGSFLDLSASSIGISSTDILSVSGSITLTDFAFSNLIGWDAATADLGAYTLINGGGSVTLAGSTPTISNPFDFGNGKQGYFQQGSLQVVVIPEPAAVLLGAMGLLALLRRRRA